MPKVNSLILSPILTRTSQQTFSKTLSPIERIGHDRLKIFATLLLTSIIGYIWSPLIGIIIGLTTLISIKAFPYIYASAANPKQTNNEKIPLPKMDEREAPLLTQALESLIPPENSLEETPAVIEAAPVINEEPQATIERPSLQSCIASLKAKIEQNQIYPTIAQIEESDSPEKFLEYALAFAARKGSMDMIKALEPRITNRTLYNWTLIRAAESGHNHLVTYLLPKTVHSWTLFERALKSALETKNFESFILISSHLYQNNYWSFNLLDSMILELLRTLNTKRRDIVLCTQPISDHNYAFSFKNSNDLRYIFQLSNHFDIFFEKISTLTVAGNFVSRTQNYKDKESNKPRLVKVLVFRGHGDGHIVQFNAHSHEGALTEASFDRIDFSVLPKDCCVVFDSCGTNPLAKKLTQRYQLKTFAPTRSINKTVFVMNGSNIVDVRFYQGDTEIPKCVFRKSAS